MISNAMLWSASGHVKSYVPAFGLKLAVWNVVYIFALMDEREEKCGHSL